MATVGQLSSASAMPSPSSSWMGAPPLLEDAATREDEPTLEDAGALEEEPPEVATELEFTTDDDITGEDADDAAGMLEESRDEEPAEVDAEDVNVVALLLVEEEVVLLPPLLLLLAEALVHMPWVHTCWAPQSAVVLHAVWQECWVVLHTSLLRQSWEVLQVSLGVHASSAPRAKHPPRTSRCVKRPMWLGSVARRGKNGHLTRAGCRGHHPRCTLRSHRCALRVR